MQQHLESSPASETGSSGSGEHIIDGSGWRYLAGSLDGVARAFRVQGGDPARLAERTVELWSRYPDDAVIFFPTEAKVRDVICLQSDATEGRWILPAFMSGLRSLASEPALNIDSVLRLAEELSVLDTRIDSINSFQNWLWEDGAEGFRVELQPSFVEAMEEAEAGIDELQRLLGATRGEALVGLDSSSLVSMADLDAAAMREEFDVEFQAPREETGAGGSVSTSERESFLGLLDDGPTWLSAELHSIVDLPELRDQIAPDRMARRIQAIASQEADERLIDFIDGLDSGRDEYNQRLGSALTDLRIEQAVARGLARGAPSAWRRFSLWIADTRDERARPAITLALRRLFEETAERDREMLSEAFFGGFSDSTWMNSIEASQLGEATSLRLFDTLGTRGDQATQLTFVPSLLEELPSEAAVRVLTRVPSAQLSQFVEPMKNLLARCESVHSADRVLTALLSVATADADAICADYLLRSGGHGWRPSTLDAVVVRMTANEGSARQLLRLARDRGAGVKARIRSLVALRRHPALEREALRKRLSEISEPDEIKAALQKLRAVRSRSR